MATQLSTLISQELNIPINQVAGTVNLLDDGATIPFISRYRKEATGNLDELSIQSIDQRLPSLYAPPHSRYFRRAGDKRHLPRVSIIWKAWVWPANIRSILLLVNVLARQA